MLKILVPQGLGKREQAIVALLERGLDLWRLLFRRERPHVDDALRQPPLLEQVLKERVIIRALIGTHTIHALTQARKARARHDCTDLLPTLQQTLAYLSSNALAIGKNQPVTTRSGQAICCLVERGRRCLPPAWHKEPLTNVRDAR